MENKVKSLKDYSNTSNNNCNIFEGRPREQTPFFL